MAFLTKQNPVLTSQLLRKATAAAHKAAEERLNAESILDGTLSTAGFVDMMQLHYNAWSVVSAWWPVGDATKPTAKAFLEGMVDKLRLDLETSGFSPSSPPQLLLNADDVATRHGALYVLRGSTLGGTMINRKLKGCSGLSELPAFHFHAACEALPGKVWPAFLRELDAAVTTEAEQMRAVAGADAVFGLYLATG